MTNNAFDLLADLYCPGEIVILTYIFIYDFPKLYLLSNRFNFFIYGSLDYLLTQLYIYSS